MLLTTSLLIASSAAASEAPWIEDIGRQYFAVSVEDVDRAAAWYRTAFGLEVLDDNSAEDGAWRIVNLRRDGLFVELIFTVKDGPASRSKGFAKVGFGVPDVRVVADRVESATGERPRVLDFARHAVRLIQIHDPEGNVIQLTSPLESAAPAESSGDAAARGRARMQRAIEALGGDALGSIESLRVVADCTRGDREFTTEVTSRRPDRTIFAQRSGERAQEMWVLGDEGFFVDLTTGERQPLNEPQRAMAAGHEFHFLLFELDQRFSNLRVIGREEVGDRSCTAVAAEDETGQAAAICFDDASHLPLVLTYEPPGGGPGDTIRMVFEEWRDIDGVQYVSAFSLVHREETFTYRYHTIEPNSVPEERFAFKPS